MIRQNGVSICLGLVYALKRVAVTPSVFVQFLVGVSDAGVCAPPHIGYQPNIDDMQIELCSRRDGLGKAKQGSYINVFDPKASDGLINRQLSYHVEALGFGSYQGE